VVGSTFKFGVAASFDTQRHVLRPQHSDDTRPEEREVPGPNIPTGEVDKRYQSVPSRRGHAVKLSGRAPETLLVGLYEDVTVPEFPVLVVRLHSV
jgi:hypothetical protein